MGTNFSTDSSRFIFKHPKRQQYFTTLLGSKMKDAQGIKQDVIWEEMDE